MKVQEKGKMSKITVADIRLRYITLKDPLKVSEDKIQAEINAAYDQGALDGLSGSALDLGVRHLACHYLLLDMGPLKEHESKEKNSVRFGSDPAANELKHYNNLVDKYSKNGSDSFLIRS